MKLPYDPVKDLAPITMGVNFPNVLVVNADLGIKTFADFIAYARKNPGKLDYASTGAGSASHLAGELMDDMAKIDTVHVPYKGGAPALQDLLGGRVAMYYSTLNTGWCQSSRRPRGTRSSVPMAPRSATPRTRSRAALRAARSSIWSSCPKAGWRP